MCIRRSSSQFVISVYQTSSRQNLSPEERSTSRFDLSTLGVSADIFTYYVFSEEDAISVMDEFHKRGVKTVILSRFRKQVAFPPPLFLIVGLWSGCAGCTHNTQYTYYRDFLELVYIKTIKKIVNKKVEDFLVKCR